MFAGRWLQRTAPLRVLEPPTKTKAITKIMNQETSNGAATAVETSPNPFANLEAFKVNQDFNEFETAIDYSVIPLKKPGKQQWIRVHPEFKLDNVCFLEVEQEEGGPENYMLTAVVAPQLRDLPGISKRCLRLCVCRPNCSPFLWAIKMPKGTGTKHDEWGRSAMVIAEIAESKWVRVNSDMQLGAYKHHTASVAWEEPTWPDLTAEEILLRSIGEQHIIASVDHSVIRQLRGLE